MKFDEIVEKERKSMTIDGRGFMLLIATLFDLKPSQIGAMINPPKSAHTINGYRRKGYHKHLPEKDKNDIIKFIEKNYTGKNPRKNLINRINKRVN